MQNINIMSQSDRLELPLLFAAQAQKHVTVNEALLRLEALSHMMVRFDLTEPPSDAPGGMLFVVGQGASGDWAGRENQLAYWGNGRWEFARPVAGMSVWAADEGARRMFDGETWLVEGDSASGRQTKAEIINHDIIAGKQNNISLAAFAGRNLGSVAVEIVTPLSGTELTSWSGGIDAQYDRIVHQESGLSNFQTRQILTPSCPVNGQTKLTISADFGEFAAGSLRFTLGFIW